MIIIFIHTRATGDMAPTDASTDMNIRNWFRIILAALAFWSSTSIAQLSGELRTNWTTSFFNTCSQQQRANPANQGLPDAMLGQYCTCAAEQTANSLNNELVASIDSGEQKLPDTVISNVSAFCVPNFKKYSNVPASLATAVSANGGGVRLFNGRTQRFTAYRQFVYTKDWQLLESRELPNGKYLFDINILLSRSINMASDAVNGAPYTLLPTTGMPLAMQNKGFDFKFFVPEISGTLTINSKRNIYISQYFDPRDGKNYETHYVRSQALICSALAEAKTRIQKSMAISIFKEILLVAIKSYAGTSYSGGTFTGSNANGNTVTGTYTQYNKAWLGEHYSRGLDAVFNGTASMSQVNGEIERLECSSL